MRLPGRMLIITSLSVLCLLACDKQQEAKNPASQEEAEQTEKTADKPRQLDAQHLALLDISERTKNGKNGIAITFSTAIDSSQNIQPYFLISGKEGAGIDGSWQLDEDNKRVWFMHTEPEQTYEVTVNPGITALNGSKLLRGDTATIETRALLPSVNFDSDGMVLPVGYASGLPVVSVNIAAVDVDFFRISENKIASFIDFVQTYGRKSWYAQNLTSYGELCYSARFDLNPPKNTRSKRDLFIQNIDELKKPGLYLAVMRAAGKYENREITWFSITDIGLHLRQYDQQMDVHTASLSSGEALGDITLELYGEDNQIIQSNTTTPEGLASFQGEFDSARVLVAKSKNQYSLLNLNQPALDLSEFNIGDRPQLPQEFFIYAPRDLYRPGESAIFSGLLRDHDGKLQQVETLNGEIRAPSGSVVKSFKWQGDAEGYYQYNWSIPETAATGNWSLVVSGTLSKAVTYNFHVEEFLPERMKLTLAAERERTEIIGSNHPLDISILGEYLYGAPAAGNKFGSVLQVSQWRDPIPSLKGYLFGNLNDQRFQSYQELNDVFLDDQGKAILTIQPSWSESSVPLKVSVIGSLYESGGRPVTRAHPVLIWPAESMIGIRPHFGDKNPSPGSSVKFDLVNANLKGELQAADNVEVTLIREDRQYFWEYNQHQGWHWNYSEKEFPVASESLALESKTPGQVSFPVDWGRYRLEAKNLDTGILSSVRFFAGHDWYYDWKNANNAAARPDKINLALDKATYNAGDIAELKILPPTNGDVLILLESDRPLWSKKMPVSTQGSLVKIPIDPSWDSHNLYVSALLIQPSGKSKQTTPKRALGLIHLPLNREPRRLGINIEAPEKILPQSTLSTHLSLAQPPSSAQKTYVTLAAVDVGVLSISDFTTPSPFDFFFGQRRYAVEAKDLYADVIEVHDAEKAVQRFGGDADLVRGGEKPQSEVQIVSLFSGPVAFDEQGNALVELEVPDFNGSLRLMALGFSDDKYGSDEQTVTVAAPIIAEIAMPRFLARGDESLLALDIQNLTEQTQTLSVELSVEHPLSLKMPLKKSVTLAAKEKQALQIPVIAAGQEGAASIRANISGEDIENFTRSWQLGVRPAYPAVTENLQALLYPGESFSLTDKTLPGAIPATLQASVSLSPIVNLQINNQLKNLLGYPYGCLEQSASRAWPLTFATTENQQRFGLTPIAEDKRRDMIQKGIDRILSFQRRNGSFGLWDNDSPEEHWLSVYATDFLLNARTMGMDVPEQALEKALQRLDYYVNSANSFIRQRWSDDPKHYAFSTRAYASYVLSKVKRARLGTLRNLYNSSFDHANTGLSQIQLGLALLQMGDKNNGAEALAKALRNFPQEYRYWGDYGSEIRDLGMSIYLLLEHQQLSDEALRLSLQLRDATLSKPWLSTQERIALFMAGIALEESFSSPWKALWRIGDGEIQNIENQQGWHKLLNSEQLQEGFLLTSEHSKPLYLGALVNGYSEHPPEATDAGISVVRNWYNSEGKAIQPESVKSGDLLLVHLNVSSDKRLPDTLVINLLPAGLELENQNLEHAIKLDEFKIEGETIPKLMERTRLVHEEFRDDRYVAAVELNGYSESHLFYLVRAVTPGNYLVPPVLAEDMYRPQIRGVSETIDRLRVK